jgi:hypothetical protein
MYKVLQVVVLENINSLFYPDIQLFLVHTIFIVMEDQSNLLSYVKQVSTK